MRYYLKATTRELNASLGERHFTHFLKRNPLLLVSAFNTGNNTILVCPEFRFGNRLRADFVVLSGDSGGWDVHLVELEPVGSRIFLADGTESRTLRQAKKQVADWNQYITAHQQDFREELAISIVHHNVFRSRYNYIHRANGGAEITDVRYGFHSYYYIVVGRRGSLCEEDVFRRSYYHEFNRCELVTYDRFLDEATRLDEGQRELDHHKREWRAKHAV
jgi:hypothetical protein